MARAGEEEAHVQPMSHRMTISAGTHSPAAPSFSRVGGAWGHYRSEEDQSDPRALHAYGARLETAAAGNMRAYSA